MPTRPCLLLMAAACLGLAACSKKEIQSYKVAKDAPADAHAGHNHGPQPGMAAQLPDGHPPLGGELPDGHPPIGSQLPDGHPPLDTALPAGHPPVGGTPATTGAPVVDTAQPAAPGDVSWTAPASWTPKPLGQMRRGSYAVKDASGVEADLSIFVFPGAAGGNLENINRWRSQIALGPISAADLGKETSAIKSSTGVEVLVVDLRGTAGKSILGAIVTQQDRSWFFKLMGPSAMIEQQKPAFLDFLKTLQVR